MIDDEEYKKTLKYFERVQVFLYHYTDHPEAFGIAIF